MNQFIILQLPPSLVLGIITKACFATVFCLNFISFQAGIDRSQLRGQQLCKLLGIKESM